MDKDRRKLLKKSSALLSFTLGGKLLLLTPGQAYAKRLPLSIFNKEQADHLTTLAEAIVPGSKRAGISYYLDHHLREDSDKTLLMIRYLGVKPPFINFYLSGLASIQAASMTHYKQPLKLLASEQLNDLIEKMSAGQLDQWQGPPSPFFYFVLRADCVDVTYGTEAGFEHLNLPYSAHITPVEPW